MGAYFFDTRVITADRVLPNTFYLLYNNVGIFETTNGGVTWSLENSSAAVGLSSSAQLEATPGEAGDLWLASGVAGNAGNQGTGGALLHSTNGGLTWTAIANVTEPYAIGFGAAAPGESYPAIYMVGWVNNVYGVWQSINEAQSWTQIGPFPDGSLNTIRTISGDPNVFGEVYVGFTGSGYAVYSANGPSVLAITTSPSSSAQQLGAVVTLKLDMSEVATVVGGTPTLTLNDGGTATYVSGSGTDALTFSYTAAAGQNTAALEATALNLNGSTISDSGGNAANLSLTGLTQTGPQIDTTPSAVTAVAESNGILQPGATTTLTLDMSEAVTINTSGGTPTLTLNDGGVATYTGGSGTNALTFSYTVGAGQSTSGLAATTVNLNGASVTNANGNANLSLSGLTQNGPQVDGTSTLAIDGTSFSGSYVSATSANVILTTANPNDVIILNIAYNGPAIASISDTAGLTWHERAVAGSSGSQIYQYYAIAPNALAADSITVNFAGTAGYHAMEAFGIVGANTLSPFDTNASVPGTSNSSTVSATTSNANDLIFATYRFFGSNPTAGSGWNTIDGGSDGYLSEYQIVSAPQAGLVATTSSGENGGIIDAVVAAASTGPSTVASVVDLPASGILQPSATTTLTLDMSEAVTVNTSGGTPTLTLNDGGVATYAGGSGTNALTFSYTVAAGQNTSSLAATAVNLNGATVVNANGNANLSLAGLTQNGPQVNGTSTLGIDGTGYSGAYGVSATSASVSLTTANPNDVIILDIAYNGPAIASISDTAGLTWHERAVAGSSGSQIYQYYAIAPTALAADGITVNFAGTAGYYAMDAFGIVGANTSSPFDTNVSVPGTSNSSTVSATTSNADDLIFAAYRFFGANPTAGSGWSSIDGGSYGYLSEYQVVSSTQAGLVATASSGENGGIVDAVVAASVATGPTVSSITESPVSGDLDAGKTVTLTLNLTEAVTVAGGTPTLTLNDGGTATYVSGSGTSALTFSYTVGAGQNTAGLAATGVNLNSASISDGSGNAANLSLSGLTQSGPQIDTVTPVISAIAETPSSGDLNAGKTVTYTLTMSENVTVNTAGGSPTLTLNDGGTATYVSGSGTSALVFGYTVLAGQNTPDLKVSAVNSNGATLQDGAGNAANLSISGLAQGSPQIDTTTPTISSLVESPSSGDLDAGKTVTLTMNLTEAVTVAGGTPTLTLNDGGTATYVSGSGTSALTFNYTVGAGQSTAALAATAVNLNSASIADGAGNTANLSLSGLTQSGPQIDTTAPSVASVVASGTGISSGTGDLDAGKTVTLTLNLTEAVTVAGGTPTLTLNDGGTATYSGGSGTSALTFSYAIGAGQNTPDLTVTAVNLNAATVTDGAGNAANLTGAVTNPAGTLQIDTTTPTISSLVESPSSGDLDAGKTVTLTLNLTEAVTVAGGTPTLTLNDGGTATYSGGSGTSALTFSYTVGAGQNTAGLTATAVNLNSASITDGAGNTASLTLPSTQSGPQIDTTAPTVSSVVASGTGISSGTGDLDAGRTVTLTVNLSSAVTVAGGTPTLTLNDGGTATYVSGSGTGALAFSYTVGAGQNTPDLTVTAVNLNAATVTDGAGNAANLTGAVTNPAGTLQIDTTTPTISSLVESPSSGDLDAGKTVTLTMNLTEAVTVAGGTPTLTLNDGGTATYVSGSGTSALTFNYTVGAGQSTAALAATAVNLNSASIADGAGNTANLSLSGLTQSGPQIDTTAPSVASVVASGTGISSGTGDLDAGKTVTLTLNLTEAVTVAGGTPTLTLNDGGTATYSGGSGTSALTFSYAIGAGQNTPDLTVTAVNLNAATVTDGAGNAANLTGAVTNPAGTLQIDTTTPTISSLVESPSSGDLDAGKTVTLTLNLTEAVTVAGGTPTLTLNDGGTATYSGGSGTSALTFSYTVGAGQNTAGLTATAVNLNSASITDGAGNTANLTLLRLPRAVRRSIPPRRPCRR